jgi:hypothetical protein
MNQVGHIGDGLQSDLGSIEGAATGSSSRGEKLVASLLPLLARLRLIRGATRLVKDLLYLRAKIPHRRSSHFSPA